MLQYFDTKGVEVRILPLPTKEANKDFDLVFEVARQLEAFGINRFAACKISHMLHALTFHADLLMH